MRQYREPLRDRRRRSAQIMERYWSDPAYRLECINRDRARRGVPLHQSIEDVPTVRCSWLRRDNA